MNIHGTPLFPTLLRDAESADRFCYWSGRSGRRYIHSVYSLASFPPLPGAVYIAARRNGGVPVVLALGRFPAILDRAGIDRLRHRLGVLGATELHVHLLARCESEAESVRSDLAAAIDPQWRDLSIVSLAA
ncbi:MAG: hypothetical protein JNM20_07455 [Rhizobiales bacterium]|nr:hypothetical protein [Hyphomicrobiales bacterium]